MSKDKFATSVSCIDGRIQLPIITWVKENYDVDYIDTITEPGVDKILANNTSLAQIKSKINISITAHKSKLIIVSGHADCAGNPVPDKQHIAQINKGVELISSWNLDAKVIGIWIDNTWKINLI